MRAWEVTYRYSDTAPRHHEKHILVVTKGEEPAAIREAITHYEEDKPGGAPAAMRIVLDRLVRLGSPVVVAADA